MKMNAKQWTVNLRVSHFNCNIYDFFFFLFRSSSSPTPYRCFDSSLICMFIHLELRRRKVKERKKMSFENQSDRYILYVCLYHKKVGKICNYNKNNNKTEEDKVVRSNLKDTYKM